MGGEGSFGVKHSKERRLKFSKTMKRLWAEGLVNANSRKGEDSNKTNLTNSDVLKIKDLIIEGDLRSKEIGYLFGVTAGTIRLIQNGWNWRHIISDEDVVKMKASSKRLCVEDVIEIKDLLIEGIKTIKEIAEMFNTNVAVVASIKQGVSWRSVISEEDVNRMRESFNKTIESEVFLIVDMLKEGIKTVREIASIFDVKESVVYSIKKGASWTNFITEDDVKDMNDKRIKRGGKISKDTIMEIKDLLIEGVLSQKEIAIKVNTSDTTVSSIKSGNLWSEMLTEEELEIISQDSRTKLTADDLIEIERILSEGVINQKKIAKMFNISSTRVSNIKHGKVQKYLDK